MSWVETASGNRIASTATISGTDRIVISGHTVVAPGVVIHGDRPTSASHSIQIGKYCYLGEKTEISPPPADDGSKTFVAIRIGSFAIIGANCSLLGLSVGNRVIVEDNVRLGDFSIVYDCCVVRLGAIVPPRYVVPPFSEVLGTPGVDFVVQPLGSGWRKAIEQEAKERYYLGDIKK